MNLADIRKKAKAQKAEKDKSAVAPAATEEKKVRLPVLQVQGVPAPPVEGAPSAGAEPATDPLEALFNYCPEIDLATEEAYAEGLAALAREDREAVEQWLTFPVGNEEYALDIDHVSEIIKWREVEEIPRVPDFVLGIISLRGQVVPVFDLPRRIKLGSVEVSPASRIIVCQKGERSAGLLVDGINQVVKMPVRKTEPPPAILSGLDRDMVRGVGRYQDRMIFMLNLDHVLDAERS
ncbi:MAG: chemotaxis protein CheW [Desulfuromonadales bacterium]|nr:chemotaxis protein CheW [Desulfuromonadales bacterium]MDW7758979.1 chemotaxis protein CheW [Desulfuromonadales bacterium]